MTTRWRTKSLPLAEWAPLQDAFADLQLAMGAPANLAMFIRSQPGSDVDEIYMTGPGIEAVEARSPRGWEDADAPSGRGVALLVGEGDPWTLFGLEKP